MKEKRDIRKSGLPGLWLSAYIGIAGALILVGITVLSFQAYLAPIWVPISFALLFAWLTIRFRGRSDHIFFNVMAIFVVLALFEAGSMLQSRITAGGKQVEEIVDVYDSVRDDDLGFRQKPDQSRKASKRVNGELIYEVRISTDDKGLRISPPCRDSVDKAILFFGDSFSFGEGVNDEETLPWYVGVALAEEYRIYNFALSGWGPHQMLSLVENGRVANAVSPRHHVKHVVYQLLYPEHVFRLAGYSDWDFHGPRYILNEDGEPVRSGNFGDKTGVDLLTDWWKRSSIGNRILTYLRYDRPGDRERFVAVVIQTRDLLALAHPDLTFHLIVWDWSSGKDQRYFDRLEQAGIIIHQVKDILPGGDLVNLAFKISPMDKHPNPACHQMFANYLLYDVFQQPVDQEPSRLGSPSTPCP